MEQKKKKFVGLQGELLYALNITPEDLNANDDGYITERQRKMVFEQQSYLWTKYEMLKFIFAISGIICFVGVFFEEFFKTLIVMGSIFFLLVYLLHRASNSVQQKIKDDLANNHFETIQGIAVVIFRENSSRLEINGLKFTVPIDALYRIRHLDPYRVHYLPDRKIIISMEHIPENDNIRKDIDAIPEESNQQQSALHQDV